MEDGMSYHQDSISKHITIRANTSDDSTENAIDWAIDKALHILSNKLEKQVHLISAIPVFRSDDSIFVTVIAAPMLTSEGHDRKEPEWVV